MQYTLYPIHNFNKDRDEHIKKYGSKYIDSYYKDFNRLIDKYPNCGGKAESINIHSIGNISINIGSEQISWDVVSSYLCKGAKKSPAIRLLFIINQQEKKILFYCINSEHDKIYKDLKKLFRLMKRIINAFEKENIEHIPLKYLLKVE